MLSAVLHATAEHPGLQMNVQKLPKTLTPGITTAAGILLNCRSQNMNSHQIVTSLILKQSGAKKSAFKHLHSRLVCSSYKTVMQRQLDFGIDFDRDVKQWAQEKHEADCMERDIIESSSEEEWRKFQEGRKDCGYRLIMDNVDLVVHRRHTSREKHGTDLHMVQMIAAKNRVKGYHLNNGEPISTVSSHKLDVFFEQLEKVVEQVTAADECRHNIGHLSEWISWKELIKRASESGKIVGFVVLVTWAMRFLRGGVVGRKKC